MKHKRSKTWGIPVLVTYDGGTWYWEESGGELVFIPHGHKSRDLWDVAVSVATRRTSKYGDAVRLVLKLEAERLRGKFAYEVDQDARAEFFESLGITLSEVPSANYVQDRRPPRT